MAAPNIPLSKRTGRRINQFPPTLISNTMRMLQDLCSEMNFAKNPVHVLSKQGGKSNIVVFTCVLLASQERIRCVLRTSRYYNLSESCEDPIDDTSVQLTVVVTRMLKLRYGLPVPNIWAYDTRYENSIKCPYVIEEEVAGMTLWNYNRMMRQSLPHRMPTQRDTGRFAWRYVFAKRIAEFIAEKDKVQLPCYCASIDTSNMPRYVFNKHDDRYTSAKDSVASRSLFYRHDILVCIESFAHARTLRSYPDEKEKVATLKDMCSIMRKNIVLKDQPSVLWHADFNPRKIMFESDATGLFLTRVIDWDKAIALPRLMTREPPSFLWKDDSLMLPEWVSNGIKQTFDDTIERLVPGYKEDAYSTAAVLVRMLSG
ncbi:hypothetical protein SBOR_5011 [Sclerotinia borealis F-4128]|uniref:Aminoglycoside phosphotransferase domain-containing protein n=1 Tax=Sclerotinia borealis (strain F-4128) TaxID=1432307 RepID=W9CJ88_SCLBF|nr:hypothetical protein SBOR_5011 [Sclerotinia borealis F-4128]